MAAIRRVAGKLARDAARLEYPASPGYPEAGIKGWDAMPRDAHTRWMDFHSAAGEIQLYTQGWIDALELYERHDYSANRLLDFSRKIEDALRRRAKMQKD